MSARRNAVLAVAALAALHMTACEKPRPVAEQLADAEMHLQRGDYADAMLGFRAAVAAEPDNAEARGALAYAQYWLGDLASAEYSAGRALELGDDRSQTAVTYLRSRIAQDAAEDALQQLAAREWPLDAGGELSVRAEALLALGRYEDALGLLANSDAPVPDGTRSFLKGRAELGLGQTDQALVNLSAVGFASEHYGEALLMLATVRQSDNDLPAAEQAIDRLVNLGSKLRLPVLVAAIRMQFDLRMAQGKVAEARKPLEELMQFAPEEPGTIVSDARMAIVDGQSRRVIGPLQTLLGRHPDNQHARLLLGMALIENGNPRQGEQQLNWILANDPEFSAARVALARAKILQGRVDAAHGLLAEAGPVANPEFAELLGQVKLQLGQAGEAVAYLSNDVPIERRSDGALLDLAEAQLRLGNTDEARRLLTSRDYGSDVAGRAARLTLVLDAVSLGPQKALQRLNEALTRNPGDLELRLLAASVLVGSLDDRAAARKQLETVLAEDPENVGALYQLADIHMSEREYDAAVRRLEEILSLNLDSVPAITALAWLATVQDAGGEADRWIGELYRIGSPRANYDLLRLLLARGESQAASRLAAELTDVSNGGGSNTHLVGIAYLQSGLPSEAMPFLMESTRIAPGVADFWYYRAAAEYSLNEFDLALRSLLEATNLRPGWMAAVRLQTQALLAAGREQEAIRLARERSSSQPDDLSGRLLLAETLLASGRHVEADAALLRLPVAVLNRAAVYRWAAARREAALDDPHLPLLRWLSQFPGDGRMRIVLVQILSDSGARAEAQRQLDYLLAALPDDPVILNNIAWYLYELDTESLAAALDLARTAADGDSDNASILDTLGWLELAAGNTAVAVETLERAAALEPGDATIARHLQIARQKR